MEKVTYIHAYTNHYGVDMKHLVDTCGPYVQKYLDHWKFMSCIRREEYCGLELLMTSLQLLMHDCLTDTGCASFIIVILHQVFWLYSYKCESGVK